MSTPKRMSNVTMWLTEPMPADVAKSIERLAGADDVRRVAVMPDVHLGREVCIGAVVATSHLIYPAAVGSDIGCGMAAIRFHADARLVADPSSAARVLAGLYQHVPSNKHSAVTMSDALPADLAEQSLSSARLDKLKHRDGRVQLGTLGRGNHFVEFQADQQGDLWLMVHSGSRAMGQAITGFHMERADVSSIGLACFDANSESGQAYLRDVAWAIRYAQYNRLAMIEAIELLLGGLFEIKMDRGSLIHSSHNHVRRESHFGEQLWIHRKGAQPARAGELGIIPGSMGTVSYHSSGRGCSEAMFSSSHGAGRKLSRTAARKSVTRRQLHQQLDSVLFDHRRADALRDEAPAAYKDIRSVMRGQRDLTRIIRELRPVLSYKGV